MDRIQLSKKNRWIDEEGHVYVYMTIESIEQALGRCHQKSCKVLKELVNFGLVEQKKQGLGKPTKLYVHNFGRVWDANLQKYETHTHGSMQDIPAEVCDSYSNNTEINNTDISDINPILSGRDVDKDERSDYREYLIEQLDMAVFQDYRSEGAGDAAEADQGTGISLYFSLLGGKFCAFCNFCPLKALTILYEVNEIRMDDPVPFLKKTVGGKKIFGIIIPCSLFQRSVFSVLGIFAF